jgi:hypothetical protein
MSTRFFTNESENTSNPKSPPDARPAAAASAVGAGKSEIKLNRNPSNQKKSHENKT